MEANSNVNEKKKKAKSLFNPRPLNNEDKKNAKIALIFCIVGIVAFLVQMFYFLVRYKGFDDWLVVLIFWIVAKVRVFVSG